MPFHHIFSGPPGQTPELAARDIQSEQDVRNAIRTQLKSGPSAIRVVTSEADFHQAWTEFCAHDLAAAEGADHQADAAPTYADVLGTWAEVTDEFIKD